MFNVKEAAEISGVTKRTVEKAIENKILKVRKNKQKAHEKAGRLLPLNSVIYFSVIKNADLKSLSVIDKKIIWKNVSSLEPGQLKSIEFKKGIHINLKKLASDEIKLAKTYLSSKNKFITKDDEILGGEPVINGTRISVFSILARFKDGETLKEIADDYPSVSFKAFEVALIYASAHPKRGRPVKPWKHVA